MERMVLARLTWHLETHDRLHPMQTGFRPHLSTQDSLAMIHKEITEKAPKQTPCILVALDIKKAFDSVPYKAVLQGAMNRGINEKAVRFIKTFLEGRMYQIVIGTTARPTKDNRTGVPQGAVISLTLFNMVMTDLADNLHVIRGLSFTIYVNDVSLWTKGGPLRRQSNTLQKALDTTQAFLANVGMQLSTEKTPYTVVANSRSRKENVGSKIPLLLYGNRLTQYSSVTILGLPIAENGSASTWLQSTKKHWKQTLAIIRRSTAKAWGEDENVLKTFLRAFLVSKVMYGMNYLRLTKTQQESAGRLNREAARVITGLPKFAKIPDLYENARINKLEDLAREYREIQITRLQTTNAGRAILGKLGKYYPELPPVAHPPPPWEDILVAGTKPTPENLGIRHSGRRESHK